jgi:hypothetical protein
LSLLTHLLLDQKCNPSRKASTYFLAHRIRKRFDAKHILGCDFSNHLPLGPHRH